MAADIYCLQGRPRQYLLTACRVVWVPGVDICSLMGQDPEDLNLQSFQLGLCICSKDYECNLSARLLGAGMLLGQIQP